MNKILRYAVAYAVWILDLGLALWLVFIASTAFLGILALQYEPGNVAYANRADLADKVFWIALGLSWLIFMIVSEGYFRTGATQNALLPRLAKVTGAVLLCIFCIDLTLFWLQGGGNWLRWLILAVELGSGLILVVFGKSPAKSEPN